MDIDPIWDTVLDLTEVNGFVKDYNRDIAIPQDCLLIWNYHDSNITPIAALMTMKIYHVPVQQHRTFHITIARFYARREHLYRTLDDYLMQVKTDPELNCGSFYCQCLEHSV